MKAMDGQVIFASIGDGLASGGFLAAFALLLGASNFQIGVMTAIPFIVQPLQILAVVLVERTRMRKFFAVTAYFLAYTIWVPIACIPFFLEIPNTGAVTTMLVFIGLRGMANAFVNTSWNGWLRDIIPQDIMGNFFAKRLQLATIASVVAAIGGAIYIDWWRRSGPAEEIFGYSWAMLAGSVLFGFTAVVFMARMPEPAMAVSEGPARSILKSLRMPLLDKNFRQLIEFTFLWNFVAHLAVPFFTVYMLVKLEMSLTWVVVMGVLSQITNVFFLKVWGPFVDQFGSKVVLTLCSSLYFLVILGWTFTTQPDKHALTMPLLVLLHMLIGAASAGINIASTTIRMKMAPKAEATSYLTAVSLAANVAAGISPLLGGAFADFFEVRTLEISLTWIDPGHIFDISAFNLTGFDFLFAIAFLLGLFTLGSLSRIKEEGEADPKMVMEELFSQSRQNLRVLNSVPGFSYVANLPVRSMRRLAQIPGLDVAVGVTVHQIALSVKLAADTVSKGRFTAKQMRTKLEEVVEKVEDISQQATEIATGATKGAMKAARKVSQDVHEWVGQSVHVTLQTLGKNDADSRDTLRGATQGVIQGALEAELDLNTVLASLSETALKDADYLQLSEKEIIQIIAETAHGLGQILPPTQKALLDDAILNQIFLKRPGTP